MNCPIALKLCDYQHSVVIRLQFVPNLLGTSRNYEDFLSEMSLRVKF
jgi:hypothetical protein